MALNPPDPDQAEEYNIKYDMKYWGTGLKSKIQATFGRGTVNSQISE